MPRTGGLATPSMHPYRPFAAAEAAADRHRVASTATRLLRGYYEATTRATTRLLRGYYAAITRLLRGYYQATTRLLPGYYEATTRSRTRTTRPAAQQQQHRSSAGAARLGSSKPASTIRTLNGRSRGGRSPRAAQVGQIRRLSTPHPLVQPALVLVVPASYHRLADEAGHDDQAGLGLGHHDRAVHDVEAPAQARSQHSRMWPAVARCATDVKHKEGGQQAHDEQLQQRSGRREGRTQHDRAHEPAPTAATAGASEHDSGIASAREYLYILSSSFLSLFSSSSSIR
jgi:hypothetical protein